MKKVFTNISSAAKWSSLLGIVFFILGVATLTHYGINWDTINHLPRGQAYLNYFLFGKKDYSNLPKFERYWQDPDKLSISSEIIHNSTLRSIYQSDATDFNWFMENDGNGHPPLSDIMSSFFNFVLFQKTRLVNDIDSYRIYSLTLSSLLVFLITYWTFKVFGKTQGIISGISLGTYPLFWAESHFNNEKDIPETFYWSLFMFCVWKGITTKNWKWIAISGVPLGFALGTKFNIFFSVFAILPWVVYWLVKNKDYGFGQVFKITASAVVSFLVGVTIFIASWPYLWPDVLGRVSTVFDFYKGIGITQNTNPLFVGPSGINTYPLIWIFYTTIPIVLVFFAVGIFKSVKSLFTKDSANYLFFLLWFVVPIARVVWPGATVYGGIRQIMEYIPAMAVITGIGGGYLLLKIKNHIKFPNLIFISCFLFLCVLPLYKYHPNENVYFNFFVGGLSGAKQQNIPSWGNTFGSSYRSGISWLNKNAEQGATAAFARSILPNLPIIWVRKDIDLHNGYRSGSLAKGEYIIDLNYQGIGNGSYFDKYLYTMVNPVFSISPDNVPVLIIWKNDINHLKDEFKQNSKLNKYLITRSKDGAIKIDLKEILPLSSIELKFGNNKYCGDVSFGQVKISSNGKDWDVIPGDLPNQDWSVPAFGNQPLKNSLFIAFAADKARYVEISALPKNACLFNVYNSEIKYYTKTTK